MMPRGLLIALVAVLVLAVAGGAVLAGVSLRDGGGDDGTAAVADDDSDINAAIEEILAGEGVFEELDELLADEELPDHLDQEEGALGSSDTLSVGISLIDVGGLVVVLEVVQGSPAAQAGVMEDDVIVAVEDEPVMTAESVADIVGENEQGAVLTFAVDRNGEELEIDVEMPG